LLIEIFFGEIERKEVGKAIGRRRVVNFFYRLGREFSNGRDKTHGKL
jgi:hypothetical protein